MCQKEKENEEREDEQKPYCILDYEEAESYVKDSSS